MGLKIVMPAEYQRVREISLTAMPLGGWGVKTQE
jgi:hypothetical protein